jgi:hypothetical protein
VADEVRFIVAAGGSGLIARVAADEDARMKKFIFLSCCIALGAFAGVAGVGCGDDDEHDLSADCEAIAEACHEVQTTEAQECHENAEDTWSAEQCTAMKAGCLAICPTGPDAGPQ